VHFVNFPFHVFLTAPAASMASCRRRFLVFLLIILTTTLRFTYWTSMGVNRPWISGHPFVRLGKSIDRFYQKDFGQPRVAFSPDGRVHSPPLLQTPHTRMFLDLRSLRRLRSRLNLAGPPNLTFRLCSSLESFFVETCAVNRSRVHFSTFVCKPPRVSARHRGTGTRSSLFWPFPESPDNRASNNFPCQSRSCRSNTSFFPFPLLSAQYPFTRGCLHFAGFLASFL